MSTASCRSPTPARSARYAVHARPPAPADAVGRARPARRWPRSPRWPRRGCSATWCRPSRTARPSATSTRSSLVLAGFLVRADGADPLRPLRLARCSASRCWPSCARTSSSNTLALPRRHRRAGRHRRPAHPHHPRRRPARLVGALGAARVDDRGGHRGRSPSSPRSRVGWWVALPCLLGVPPLVIGLRWYLAPRQGRLPARERDVLRRSTRRSPRPSRAPAPSRRSASATSGSPASTTTSRTSYRAERYTLVPAHGLLPDRWRSPT